MNKTLSQVFTDKQQEAIRTSMWWVADREKPYLMKFALHEDFILLQLTDLKSLWANKFHIKTLLEQKNNYARSLQIKENRDLLVLFESLLSASDPEALYIFSELKSTEINFTFKKRISIFDFNWTLRLLKISCNQVDLICRQILNPLSATLEAQTKRIEMLRKKFQLIEKEYIRKMSEMEKALYKSPLAEDLSDWKLVLPKLESKLLNYIKFDEAGKFFYKHYVCEDKKQKVPDPMIVFNDQKKNKAIARVMSNDVFEMAQHQLNKQLQRERIMMKREKKIDFI